MRLLLPLGCLVLLSLCACGPSGTSSMYSPFSVYSLRATAAAQGDGASTAPAEQQQQVLEELQGRSYGTPSMRYRDIRDESPLLGLGASYDLSTARPRQSGFPDQLSFSMQRGRIEFSGDEAILRLRLEPASSDINWGDSDLAFPLEMEGRFGRAEAEACLSPLRRFKHEYGASHNSANTVRVEWTLRWSSDGQQYELKANQQLQAQRYDDAAE